MKETEFLELDDLLVLASTLGVGPVRDVGLLDSAVGRARSTVLGTEAYRTAAEKAAAYLHTVARNHPLVDGNKRLAWLAAVVFLDLNGLRTTLAGDEAFELVMAVAAGELEADEIARRLRVRTLPRRQH